MRAVLALFLLASLASAQTSVSADSVQTGRISGLVSDAETGEPLIGANVYLVGTQIGAATDIDGRFTIEAVPVGTHTVRAAYIGYVQIDTEVDVVADRVTAFSPEMDISGDLTICSLCADEPLFPRGPFTVRVMNPVPDGGWCSTMEPGMVYQREAGLRAGL